MKGKRKEEGHPLYICSELVDISSDITHTRNYLISNKNVYRVVALFFSGDCIGGETQFDKPLFRYNGRTVLSMIFQVVIYTFEREKKGGKS